LVGTKMTKLRGVRLGCVKSRGSMGHYTKGTQSGGKKGFENHVGSTGAIGGETTWSKNINPASGGAIEKKGGQVVFVVSTGEGQREITFVVGYAAKKQYDAVEKKRD